MDEVTAYIGLGSNLGDRKQSILRALAMLTETSGVKLNGVSTFLETDPIGLKDQPRYINCVVAVTTKLDPSVLHRACLEIEKRLGRVRAQRWAPRKIDLDILLYGKKTVRQLDLVIPHPEIANRPFVQAGLAELGVRG
jgi:2-amino-4-hydroxy-6-hydroxymethyldihydropteridine diphosphokinase